MSSLSTGKVSVSTDPRGKVASITIDRGTTHAALTLELLTELEARIDQITDTAAQVVILRTPGTKAIPSSAEIAGIHAPALNRWRQWIPIGHRVFDQLAQLPQPTIAVVDGLGIGGGAELALACDFRVATDCARIGRSEVGLGTIAGWGGTQRLTQLIGTERATKATQARRPLDATTAATWGLLTSIATAEDLEHHVGQLVDSLLGSTSALPMNYACGNASAGTSEPSATNYLSSADYQQN